LASVNTARRRSSLRVLRRFGCIPVPHIKYDRISSGGRLTVEAMIQL
jgi:hypothetical protein